MRQIFSLVLVLIAGVFVGALAVVVTGCGSESSDLAPAPDRRVMVAVPPLVGLIKPLVASDVEVVSVVPANVSVHGFAPEPDVVAKMARSSMLVLVGYGMEDAWARRSSASPLGRVVRLEDLIDPEFDVEPAGDPEHNHDHGDHAGHHHGPVDPHIWLDPVLVGVWLKALYATIPDDLRGDEAAFASQLERIGAVNAAYAERLAPFQGASIVTHHNAFGRIGMRYGIRVAESLRPLETAEPSPEQIAKTRKAIDREGAQAMFVEPQFDQTLARRLAADAGIPVGVLDPLGADWETMMRSNLDELATILKPVPQMERDASAQP